MSRDRIPSHLFRYITRDVNVKYNQQLNMPKKSTGNPVFFVYILDFRYYIKQIVSNLVMLESSAEIIVISTFPLLIIVFLYMDIHKI